MTRALAPTPRPDENVEGMGTFDAHGMVLETLLMEAIESANMAICVYDEEGRYVTVNECACTVLGYTRDELLVHDVGDFTEGGIDRSVLMSPEHREGVRLVTRKDGSKVRDRRTEYNATVLVTAGGRRLGPVQRIRFVIERPRTR